MPLANLNTLKEQGATFRPTLLVTITFSTGLVLRLSTITCTWNGNTYQGRIADEAIDRIQALSEQGIDRVPALSLQIADPDAVIWTNYERVAGFKGALLEARFIFLDPFTPDTSSDSLVVFSGVCNLPRFDQETISLQVQNKANLQKVLLPIFPIQRRCANLNPATVAQRAGADNEDSPYYPCGETRDLTTAPPCSYTKATCTQPNRFSGVTWEPPQGGRSREYTSGQWLDIRNNANEAKYGDFYPLVYGTAWVEPPVINVTGDANYTRGECVVMAGEATQILRVIVNDVELSPATAMDGTPYISANKDFRFHIINRGVRDGAPNLDTPYNGQGDPYGNLCAIYWVVPRRVADASSTPNIKVLLQGAKVRVYSDPTTFTRQYSDNWAWVLADLLTRTKYTWADLNIASFIAAAAVYDGTITYTDQFGNASATERRGSCSLVLRQRRSLADILRGVRLASGMLLVPNADGKLSILVKGTLADQQPAPVAGSNFNTAVASKVRTGATTNGYVAYSFDGGSILRRGGKSTLVRLDRAINDLPNRVAFQFSDRDYGYAPSNFAIIDSDDIARAGQEVAGGLTVEPLGINSYNAANRMTRQILNENLRGNPLGNTNGTDYWAWETSVKGLRLQMGQIVRLSDTRAGLSNVLIRLTSIQPSRDYQTIRLEGHVHNDDWYLDSAGQANDPAASGRRRDLLDRPAYPWRPNKGTPITGDALHAATDKTFALQPVIEYAADGTPIVKLSIAGQLPVNEFAALRPPVIGTQGTTASSGGSIAGGGRVYHFTVCARDANGKLSTPSPLCVVAVTNAGNSNTVTIPIVAWDPGQTGYEVFGGLDPNAMCWQASGSGSAATSITLTALQERSFGVPDIEFDRLLIRIKRVQHSGILGTAAAAVSSTTITIGGSWTANALAGYEISLLGKADNSALPVANFTISANTTDGVLTVSPDPTTHVAVGDAVVVRSKPSISGAVITDANWVNHFGPTGLDPNALTGFVLRVIKGLGRGKTYTIASNTNTTITLVQEPEMDATSRYIVEEPAWLPDQADSSTVDNGSPSREASFLIPTGNYQQQTLLVQAVALDGGSNEAFEALAPVRDIYQFGAPITDAFRAVTASAVVMPLDRFISADTSGGSVTLTLPAPAAAARQTFTVKRRSGGANSLTIAPAAGTIEGVGSLTLDDNGDYVDLYSDGTTYLKKTSGGSISVTPGAPPAENVATVTATVFYNADRWGIEITVSFDSSRANIARGEIIVRGPTNFGVSVDRRGWSFIPPTSGDYTTTLGGEWLRAGSAHEFVVLVETYNSDGAPTAAPISSSTITVEPVNNTTQATSLSATVFTEKTADGLEVFGFNLGFTQANDADTSHTEIWIRDFDAAISGYRAEQIYTQTGPGGGDNGFARTEKGRWLDATPASSKSYRLIFYTITKTGVRKASAPFLDVTVTAGAGGLKLNRADAATLGPGLAVVGGQLRIPTSGVAGNMLQALSVTANELANAAVTGPKYAAQSIPSAAIGLAAVNNTHIADATIQSAKIFALAAEKLLAGTVTVGAGGMTFSGPGGIQIQTGAALTNINSSGVVSPNVYALAGSHGWSMIGGGAPVLTFAQLFAGGYADVPALRVGGTEVISSSRVGVFSDLRYTGQFRPNIGTVAPTPTPATFTKFVLVFNPDGTTAGYFPVY